MLIRLGKVNESTQSPTDSRTRALLDFLQRMLEVGTHKSPPPPKLLEELGRELAADGGGVAAPLDGLPQLQYRWPAGDTGQRYPWDEQPQLLTALRVNPTAAVQCRASGKSYLTAMIPPVGPGSKAQLLWLERGNDRAWNPAEESGLVLAARVLAPFFQTEPTGNRVFPGLDQVRLQERLQDAGTISARVAHAFDNLLTGILGFAELTLSQTEASSPNRSFLDEVVRAAQQGVQLTQQLHFFSRCAVPTVGPATLAYVIGEEEARLRGAIPTGTRLTVDVPADLPSVAMDAELLRQIIGHLADNAREAMTSGTLSITARRATLEPPAMADLLGQPVPGPCVEVIVTDSGPEISADVRRRLFQEPFFSTKPRHRGLGLAIVYRVLQAHRGCFRLVTGPKGTSVHLFLPLAPA